MTQFFWQVAWLFCLLSTSSNSFGIVSLKCVRDYSGMVRWRSKILPLVLLAPARHSKETSLRKMPFMSARFPVQHEAKNLQRQNQKMCINLHRFEIRNIYSSHCTQTTLLWRGQHAPHVKMAISWISWSREITAWTAAAAPAAMASSPVSPFATLSMAILESVDVCLRCHVAIEPMFSSQTLRRFDVHDWIHIIYIYIYLSV